MYIEIHLSNDYLFLNYKPEIIPTLLKQFESNVNFNET